MSDMDLSNHSGIKWKGHVGTVEYSGQNNSVVMFYTRPMVDKQKSASTGRPVFTDKVYVRIHPPGERLNIIDREATSEDKRRYNMHWMQFQENREQVPEGTPIDFLYPDQPSIASMMKANGVFTVEQCAELSAQAIENIGMGAQTHTNNAKKYLDVAMKGAKGSQFRRDIEALENRNRSLEHEITVLKEQVQKLSESRDGAGISMQQLQQLVAGNQERPTFPGGRNLPKNFDAQTSQINATHPTKDVSPKKSVKKPAERSALKRERVRVAG